MRLGWFTLVSLLCVVSLGLALKHVTEEITIFSAEDSRRFEEWMQNNHMNGTILTTYFNEKGIPLARTFLCSLRALGYHKHLFAWVFDEASMSACEDMGIFCLPIRISMSLHSSAYFGEVDHKKFSKATVTLWHYVSRAGYNVVWVEIDQTFIMDVMPYFLDGRVGGGARFKGVTAEGQLVPSVEPADLFLQYDGPNAGFGLRACVGFFFSRHSARTVSFWERMAATFDENQFLNNGQVHINRFLYPKMDTGLVIEILHPTVFAGGYDSIEEFKVSPAFIHWHWMQHMDAKVVRIKKSGLWLSSNDNTCVAPSRAPFSEGWQKKWMPTPSAPLPRDLETYANCAKALVRVSHEVSANVPAARLREQIGSWVSGYDYVNVSQRDASSVVLEFRHSVYTSFINIGVSAAHVCALLEREVRVTLGEVHAFTSQNWHATIIYPYSDKSTGAEPFEGEFGREYAALRQCDAQGQCVRALPSPRTPVLPVSHEQHKQALRSVSGQEAGLALLKGKRLLGIDLAPWLRADIRNRLGTMGIQLLTHHLAKLNTSELLSQCPDPVEFRRQFYLDYGHAFDVADAFLCTYPLSMCELLMPFGKPMLVLFDKQLSDGRQSPEAFKIFVKSLLAIAAKPYNIIAATSTFGQEYLKYVTGVPKVVLLPLFPRFYHVAWARDEKQHLREGYIRKDILFALHDNPAILAYVHAANSISRQRGAGVSFAYMRSYHNGFYKEPALPYYRAFVCVPYTLHTPFLYRQLYEMGHPLLFPSPSFLQQLSKRDEILHDSVRWYDMPIPEAMRGQKKIPNPNHITRSSKIARYWMKHAEFYSWPHTIQFDSWADLVDKVQHTDFARLHQNILSSTAKPTNGPWLKVLVNLLVDNVSPPLANSADASLAETYGLSLADHSDSLARGCKEPASPGWQHTVAFVPVSLRRSPLGHLSLLVEAKQEPVVAIQHSFVRSNLPLPPSFEAELLDYVNERRRQSTEAIAVDMHLPVHAAVRMHAADAEPARTAQAALRDLGATDEEMASLVPYVLSRAESIFSGEASVAVRRFDQFWVFEPQALLESRT